MDPDLDPGGKMNADPGGSGPTALPFRVHFRSFDRQNRCMFDVRLLVVVHIVHTVVEEPRVRIYSL